MDVLHLCRLCLKNSDYHFNMFTEIISNKHLYQLINNICEVGVFHNDGLPEHICDNCFQSIRNIISFKTQAKETEATFTRMKRFQNMILSKLKEKEGVEDNKEAVNLASDQSTINQEEVSTISLDGNTSPDEDKSISQEEFAETAVAVNFEKAEPSEVRNDKLEVDCSEIPPSPYKIDIEEHPIPSRENSNNMAVRREHSSKNSLSRETNKLHTEIQDQAEYLKEFKETAVAVNFEKTEAPEVRCEKLEDDCSDEIPPSPYKIDIEEHAIPSRENVPDRDLPSRKRTKYRTGYSDSETMGIECSDGAFSPNSSHSEDKNESDDGSIRTKRRTRKNPRSVLKTVAIDGQNCRDGQKCTETEECVLVLPAEKIRSMQSVENFSHREDSISPFISNAAAPLKECRNEIHVALGRIMGTVVNPKNIEDDVKNVSVCRKANEIGKYIYCDESVEQNPSRENCRRRLLYSTNIDNMDIPYSSFHIYSSPTSNDHSSNKNNINLKGTSECLKYKQGADSSKVQKNSPESITLTEIVRTHVFYRTSRGSLVSLGGMVDLSGVKESVDNSRGGVTSQLSYQKNDEPKMSSHPRELRPRKRTNYRMQYSDSEMSDVESSIDTFSPNSSDSEDKEESDDSSIQTKRNPKTRTNLWNVSKPVAIDVHTVCTGSHQEVKEQLLVISGEKGSDIQLLVDNASQREESVCTKGIISTKVTATLKECRNVSQAELESNGETVRCEKEGKHVVYGTVCEKASDTDVYAPRNDDTRRRVQINKMPEDSKLVDQLPPDLSGDEVTRVSQHSIEEMVNLVGLKESVDYSKCGITSQLSYQKDNVPKVSSTFVNNMENADYVLAISSSAFDDQRIFPSSAMHASKDGTYNIDNINLKVVPEFHDYNQRMVETRSRELDVKILPQSSSSLNNLQPDLSSLEVSRGTLNSLGGTVNSIGINVSPDNQRCEVSSEFSFQKENEEIQKDSESNIVDREMEVISDVEEDGSSEEEDNEDITENKKKMGNEGAFRKRYSTDEGTCENSSDEEKKEECSLKRREYLCDECGKVFRHGKIFHSHRKVVHCKEKQHICEICDKTFAVKHLLVQHARTHRDIRPFACKICGKGFKFNSHLKQHNMVHSGKKMYVCTHCEMDFDKKTDLDAHQPSHDNQKIWRCNGCSVTSHTWAEHLNHQSTHTWNRTFTCGTCGKVYSSRSSLVIHTYSHTKPFECTICKKSFSDKRQLSKHMSIHPNQKPYVYDQSKKLTLNYSGHLLEHNYVGSEPINFNKKRNLP